jgi:endogenous inhibitor of DNA gyrase (YacG/DUF329 family)
MIKLFETVNKNTRHETCMTCAHRQRWESNSKIIQYCSARKSNRTANGLLKIKCKDKACELYAKEKGDE